MVFILIGNSSYALSDTVAGAVARARAPSVGMKFGGAKPCTAPPARPGKERSCSRIGRPVFPFKFSCGAILKRVTLFVVVKHLPRLLIPRRFLGLHQSIIIMQLVQNYPLELLAASYLILDIKMLDRAMSRPDCEACFVCTNFCLRGPSLDLWVDFISIQLLLMTDSAAPDSFITSPNHHILRIIIHHNNELPNIIPPRRRHYES